MPKLTYAQQLLHPNWQRMRLKVLEAANFSCCDCGTSEATLHVHHKRYIKGRMAWEYEEEDLEALCAGCHEKKHEIRDAVAALVTRWEQEHMSLYDLRDMIAGALSGKPLDCVAGKRAEQPLMLGGVEDWSRYNGSIAFDAGAMAFHALSVCWSREEVVELATRMLAYRPRRKAAPSDGDAEPYRL